MNNKIRLSVIVLSAVLLSACTATTKPTEEQTTPKEENKSISTSMRSLLAAGQNQKCVFSVSDTDEEGITTETKGTLYISGKKLAEDIQVTSTDMEFPAVNMSMVSDGVNMYSWDTAKKTSGMKFNISESDNTEDTKTKNQSVNMDKEMDMNCSPWIVDNSKFTVPTDIVFTDLSEMMKNIPTMPAIPTGE